MRLGLLYQAWQNLKAKPLQTALSLALLGFGVGMVSLMLLTEKQVNDAFERNIKDIDLVLGAKGSPLQLILANVYHIDAPTGNILQREAEKVLKHPYIVGHPAGVRRQPRGVPHRWHRTLVRRPLRRRGGRGATLGGAV